MVKTNAQKRDSLRNELREIARDMRSISPKLGLYKELVARKMKVKVELEKLEALV